MVWTYSGDPSSTDRDKVRFMIGDTDSQDPLLSDEEIMYLLDTKQSVQKAAQEACRAIIAKFAREVSYSLGPEKVEASDRLAHYKELLNELKAQSMEANAAPSWAGETNPGEPIFDLGIHDNREAMLWTGKLDED